MPDRDIHAVDCDDQTIDFTGHRCITQRNEIKIASLNSLPSLF
jgi:hypothetical protein